MRDVLRQWHLGALETEASLLVTELCSNSVLHTRSGYVVALSLDGDKLRIGVRDASKYPPVAKRRTRQAMTGRGLVLIEAYADEWGVDRHEDGKTVWVELGLRSEKSSAHERTGQDSNQPVASLGPALETTTPATLGASDLAIPGDLVWKRVAA